MKIIISQLIIYSMVKDQGHALSWKAKQHDAITTFVMKNERYEED